MTINEQMSRLADFIGKQVAPSNFGQPIDAHAEEVNALRARANQSEFHARCWRLAAIILAVYAGACTSAAVGLWRMGRP